MQNQPVSLPLLSLREWADRYLDDFAYEHAKSTVLTYSAWMNRFFLWMEDDKGLLDPTVEQLTPLLLDDYIKYQRNRPRAGTWFVLS